MFGTKNKEFLKLANEFTWGYELEGRFTKEICDTLKDTKDYYNGKYGVSTHYDSSVMLPIPNLNWLNKDYTEIILGIFQDFETMIKTFEYFKEGKNYLQNETCSLHVHIKNKNGRNDHCKVGDKDLLRKAENFAFTKLCKETRKRKTNKYCQSYYIKGGENWERRKKYSFIRNHPSGTLEFRFFSSCHKKKNIIKFFKFFFNELEKVENYKKGNFIIQNTNKLESINNYFKLQNLENEKFKTNYKLKIKSKENINLNLGKITKII